MAPHFSVILTHALDALGTGSRPECDRGQGQERDAGPVARPVTNATNKGRSVAAACDWRFPARATAFAVDGDPFAPEDRLASNSWSMGIPREPRRWALAPPCSHRGSLSSSDERLLHYWTTSLSGLLSASGAPSENNPFVIHLGAMLLEPGAVQSVVLSMSAGHLARLTDDASLKTVACRHQQTALHRLRTLVGDPIQSRVQTTLAAVLMMLVATQLFADEDDAGHCVVNHLQGASAMIGQRLDSYVQPQWTPAERFLLSIFSYHDILSSVSRGAQPLWESSAQFSAIEDVSRLQRIAAVLHLVAKISQLQQLKMADSCLDGGSFHIKAAAIEMSLQGLGPLSFDADRKSHREREIESTVQAFRHAAFIYLYRVWFDAGAPTPATLEHVEQCLSAIVQVPITSPLVSAHGWPLFTAGCESILPSQRDLARDRFEQMYVTRRFPSLRRVKGDMEEVWSRKDAEQRVRGLDGMAKIDCIQLILRGRGREVNFT